MREHGLNLNRKPGSVAEVETPQKSSSRALWGAVAVLTAGLIGLTSYGFVVMDRFDIRFSQLPGLESALQSLGLRVTTAEEKLAAYRVEADRLETRLNQVNARIRHHRKLAETHADQAVAQLEEKVQSQLEIRDQAVDARLQLVESEQTSQRAGLEAMQTGVALEQAAVRDNLNRLRRTADGQGRELEVLVQRQERTRYEFELVRDRTVEIAPGLRLHLEKTDTRQQRVKGWLWVMPDARAVWFEDLQAMESLPFYSEAGGEPRELVITRVKGKQVAGYVLVPSHDSAVAAKASAPPSSGAEVSSATGL